MADEFLENAKKRGIKLGLSRMRVLMAALSNPQDALKYIHVAGTNGKGSVIEYLSHILRRAGLKTGQYTSPAVDNVFSQYQINGVPIDKAAYDRYIGQIDEAAQRLTAQGEEAPTIFEIETALAFLYFKEEKCDIVLLETGMGGKDDATNIVDTTIVAVLTSISEDHLGMIGNNLPEIAATKSGIIKAGIITVSAPQPDEVLAVIQRVSREQGATLTVVDGAAIYDTEIGISKQTFSYKDRKKLTLTLGGEKQFTNAAVAIEVCERLQEYGYEISEEDIQEGLRETVFPFRMEQILTDPVWILDGAHNPAAVISLHNTLSACAKDKTLLFIIGMFRDKDYEEVCRIIADDYAYAVTVETQDNERALDRFVLRDTLRKYGKGSVETAASYREAVQKILSVASRCQEAGEEPLIVAFGSFSYLAGLKEMIRSKKQTESEQTTVCS